ncbi:TAT-variant-translocated molybdopterin oxidoreductase [uncultured Mesonia sp.]|uniref:TAT-variant-translocated molybdopterin oxidoreductase n=1 Tax=uncultured Mesonia sp. TaxID=399731 RepID=UPI00374E36BD
MSSNKKYWKSVEELKDNSSIVETLQQNEFVEEIPTDEFLGNKESLESSKTSRRDFLKFVGFSTAAASLAACEGPVVKSIPYVVQPERIVPGVANYYATTIANGFDFSSVLVKTREGRPIKIENNSLDKLSPGANARVHASVLSLYDTNRLQRPMVGGESVSWETFESDLKQRLDAVAGKKIVFLTQSFASPSTERLMEEFKLAYPNASHVVYDDVAEDAVLSAFEQKYGYRAMPNYDFAKAEVIVSVGADFLGDWQGGGYDSGYAKGRIPKDGKMSRHVHFESNMSLTGANADKRVMVTAAEQKQVLAALYGYVSGKSTSGLSAKLDDVVVKAKEQLRKAGSGAVVVSGLQDVDAQLLVMAINEALGSKVMSTDDPKLTKQGSVAEVKGLIEDLKAGAVGAVIMAGVNPVFTLPNGDEFASLLASVDVSVAFAERLDETAKLCGFVGAEPHYLESWGDVRFTKTQFGLTQPTIRPLFATKQFQDVLLSLLGKEENYYKYIKETCKGILGGTNWATALHDGVFTSSAGADLKASEGFVANVSISNAANRLAKAEKTNGLELHLYTKTGMGSGRQANNPWLQEFPDPLTRVSWDNYLTVSKADAENLGFVNEHVADGGLNGSYANLSLDGVVLENVPVIIQPGQAVGTLGLALGYGRKEAIQSEMQVGINAFPLYKDFNSVQNISVEKASGMHEFACVQLHKTLMGRSGDIIKETTLEIFNTKDKEHWNAIPHVSLDHKPVSVNSPEVDLWQEFDRSVGHHFNLSIDLNACTGCGACVIACHSENNVPVVGKEEVRKSRDMHWLRIDRYYSSEETFVEDLEKKDNFDGLGDSLSGFGELEEASGNPQVVFQPVMCQHCNHAPCETVCPVAATSHGRQGQNQMAYNRCVGTRYCANNCPYKVRRFNWFRYNQNDSFDYNMNNDLGRMVINPDVTVRSRGVMEKCSMCIQMTQKTILDAKREGREVKKDEFQTACSQACGTGAIQFGDINNEESEVYKNKQDDRMYHLLEYLGTKPNVFYQTKIRNTSEV